MQQLLTLNEVAEILRLPVPAIVSLIEDGVLAAIDLPAGGVRVAPQDLRIFMRARRRDFCPATPPPGAA